MSSLKDHKAKFARTAFSCVLAALMPPVEYPKRAPTKIGRKSRWLSRKICEFAMRDETVDGNIERISPSLCGIGVARERDELLGAGRG